jgi:signal transduction histidine kinase
MIEIVDNGCGMDDEFVRERLFRPFDSTKGLAGMGIGAYECKEFVTLLGGRVEVDSTPGVGTCFQILIPLATNITDQSLATAAV